MEHVFPMHALHQIKLTVMWVGFALLVVLAVCYARRGGGWKLIMINGLAILLALNVLLGCDAPINPVKYQTVPVLITRPCYAGVAPPAEAVEIGDASCPGKYAECVRDRKADIQELQREARQYRQLFKECSK